MIRSALAILLGGLCAAAASGASPDPKDLVVPPGELSKARELVRKLGSEAYREREDAHAELTKMGRKARPALLEAVGSDPDPEVRFRCSRLLPRAGADDLKARIDIFLADAEGKFEHDLPGLKHYREQVGTDKAARDLFVEIIKSPPNQILLQALDHTPAEAGRAIADRQTALVLRAREQRNLMLPLTEVACIVFAESLVPARTIPRNGAWSEFPWVLVLKEPAVIGAGAEKERHAEAYQRIIAKWMESRGVDNLDHLKVFLGPGGR